MQRMLNLIVMTVTLGGVAVWAVALFHGDRPGHVLTGWEEIAAELERSRALDHALQECFRDREQRHDVLARLERQEITLDEAMALFGGLNVGTAHWTVLRSHFPDRSEDELIGRQLLVFTQSMPMENEGMRMRSVRKLVARLREKLGPKRVPLPAHLEHLARSQ